MNLHHFDLTTPDGKITSIQKISDRMIRVVVDIEGINPALVGFDIDLHLVHFNLKSILAQIGVNGVDEQIELNKQKCTARAVVRLEAFGPIAREMLTYIYLCMIPLQVMVFQPSSNTLLQEIFKIL